MDVASEQGGQERGIRTLIPFRLSMKALLASVTAPPDCSHEKLMHMSRFVIQASFLVSYRFLAPKLGGCIAECAERRKERFIGQRKLEGIPLAKRLLVPVLLCVLCNPPEQEGSCS